jgi:uncharacterized protein (TIGR00251 family)
MSASWYRVDPKRQCLSLTVHVQPNSRANCVAGLHGDALKIKLAAAAVEGKANAELLGFMARTFNVPRRQVTLKHGAHGRRKIVEICGSAMAADDLLNQGTPKKP